LDRGYAPDGVPALLAERLDRGFDLDDLPGLFSSRSTGLPMTWREATDR
jgi:hypothetical protein